MADININAIDESDRHRPGNRFEQGHPFWRLFDFVQSILSDIYGTQSMLNDELNPQRREELTQCINQMISQLPEEHRHFAQL